MARADVDWQAIEREFRLGQFSVREIGKRHDLNHSSIVRRAKAYGWTQDRSEEVRARVRARLMQPSARSPDAPAHHAPRTNAPREPGPPPTEDEIEAAVEERVEVLRDHQRVARDFRATLANLRRELDEVTERRAEIEETIEDETRDDKTAERRNRMLRAITLSSRAQAAAVLTAGLKNAVSIERQAHGLTDGNEGATPDDAPLIIERRIVHS